MGIAVFVGVVGLGLVSCGGLLMVRPANRLSLIESLFARRGTGIALVAVGAYMVWLSYLLMTNPLF